MMMMMPLLAAAVTIGATLAAPPIMDRSAARARRRLRPNLLLLFPDQWRFDWDGFHHHQPSTSSSASDDHPSIPLSVPHIRSLAAGGVRFEHAYTPSPLCAPARACLASGREYDDCGVKSNTANDYPVDDIPTFYELLRDVGGYHTMTVGKDDLTKASHLGTDPPSLGGNWTGLYHQAELGFVDGLRCEGKAGSVRADRGAVHERFGHWLLTQSAVELANGTTISGWDAHRRCMDGRTDPPCSTEECPDGLYQDNWVTNLAIQMLQRAPSDRPWFLQVNFPGPHPPFLVTANQTWTVSNRTYAGPVDDPRHRHSNSSSSSEVGEEQCRYTGQPQKSYGGRCQYAAEIENLDAQIGRVLRSAAAALDASSADGQNDHYHRRRPTLICLSSDHGEMLGDHGALGKEYPWEGSASVPLICAEGWGGEGEGEGRRRRRRPSSATLGIARNRTISQPASIVDLAATFLDFAGVKKKGGRRERRIPRGMTSSTSLRPFLMQRDDDDGIVPTARPYRQVVHSGLKYWRMVVEVDTYLKFICCRGPCKGSPSTVPPFDVSAGYMQLLYNVSSDPFDMHPLDDEQAMSRLRAKLPVTANFHCPEKKKAQEALLA